MNMNPEPLKKSDSLFVKVDGYRIILQDLEAIRQIINNMKDTLSVLNKVAEVKEKSIETFMENIRHLNEKLGSISSQMPDIGQFPSENSFTIPEPSRKIVSDSVDNLKGELETLRRDLSKLL